jgi:hypothetical protein
MVLAGTCWHKGVVFLVEEDRVVSGTAGDIVSRLAVVRVDHIVAIARFDHVTAATTEEPVFAIHADYGVPAPAAPDRVVALNTVEKITAVIAIYVIIGGASVDLFDRDKRAEVDRVGARRRGAPPAGPAYAM